jgi:hypothetical protein
MTTIGFGGRREASRTSTIPSWETRELKVVGLQM